MASSETIETVLCGEDLRPRLCRPSKAQQGEETKIASRLSGVVAVRHVEDALWPSLLQGSLMVPARLGPRAMVALEAR